MELMIKATTKQEIIVMFGKQTLEISEISRSWNTEGINKFLVALATNVPDHEVISLKIIGNDIENPVLDHVHALFKSFVDQYNLHVS